MSSKNRSDILKKAFNMALSDRFSMMDCLENSDDIESVKHEIGMLRKIGFCIGSSSLRSLEDIRGLIKATPNLDWFAMLQWAIQNSESLYECMSLKKDKKAAYIELQSFYRLRKELFPGKISKLESDLSSTVPMTVREIQSLSKESREWEKISNNEWISRPRLSK